MIVYLHFRHPQAVEIAVGVNSNSLVITETEGNVGRIAGLQGLALTAVFRGIFYIVTMGLPQFDGLYGEKWWTSIRPYRLYAELTVQVSGDTEKTIDIKNAEYAKRQNIWLPPSASTPDGELKTELIKNEGDFKYQYLRYARGFISVASVGAVLFAVLLIITLNRQTTALAALFGVLLAACVILPVVTLITEHKRMKKLLKKAYRES